MKPKWMQTVVCHIFIVSITGSLSASTLWSFKSAKYSFIRRLGSGSNSLAVSLWKTGPSREQGFGVKEFQALRRQNSRPSAVFNPLGTSSPK